MTRLIVSNTDKPNRFTLLIWVGIAAIALAASLAFRAFDSSQHPATENHATLSAVDAVLVEGEVQSSRGELLVTASVCVYGDTPSKQVYRECAMTDGRGRYVLTLIPGAYSATASASGHASASSSLRIQTQAERLDFTLDAQQAPTLAGAVQSATGAPIAMARITLHQGATLVSSFLTDGQGEFTAWAPQGNLIVTAEAEGFGAATVYTVAPTMDLKVTLFPGNLVSGRVLIEGSQQPVANVLVVAMSSRDRIVSRLKDSAVLTDHAGRFSFPNLSVGTWLFSVADRNVWGELPDPVFVSSGQEQRDVILIVRPATEVTGRFVVQESGQPCTGGRLQLIPEAIMPVTMGKTTNEMAATRDEAKSPDKAAPVPVLSAAPDADRLVRFDAVPHGSYRAGPTCEDHRMIDGPTSLEVTGAPIAEQRWKFTRGLSLTVHVADESGTPIENAAVSMELQNTQGLSRGQVLFSNRSARTDAQGQHRFGALRASQYQVSARYAAINGMGIATTTIDLQSGGEPRPVTLTLPGRGAIRIHSHSAAGAPISRVLFFAIDSQGARYEGKYAGSGRFAIGPLPRDSYRVFGYDNKNPKLALNAGQPISISGAQSVDLDFVHDASSAVIEGRVLAGDGAALPGVLVRAVSTSLDGADETYSGIQTSLHGAQEQMTDKDGRFRIDGLQANATFDLYVDQLSGLADRRNNVRPGAFVEITLPLPGTAIGTVLNESGQAVHKFDVVVDTEGNAQSNSRSVADSAGRFRISPVNPGRVSVTIYSADGERSATRDLSVAPGQTVAGRSVRS